MRVRPQDAYLQALLLPIHLPVASQEEVPGMCLSLGTDLLKVVCDCYSLSRELHHGNDVEVDRRVQEW